MISRNNIKFVHSLALKKNRDSLGVFIAEGRKVVADISHSFVCRKLYYTSDCSDYVPQHLSDIAEPVDKAIMERMSLQKSPQGILGIFNKPNACEESLFDVAEKELCIALDGIQDPGNMGTIIRIADWFGINHVFAGIGTVDVFSPKVIGATMGAIARVKVSYVDLEKELAALDSNFIYGTFLNGESIYKSELTAHGVILMGNEGNGISQAVGRMAGRHLLIPSFPDGRPTGESLNVAIATSIVCAEFRRRETLKENILFD